MNKKLLQFWLAGMFSGIDKDIIGVGKQIKQIQENVWDNRLKEKAEEKRRRKNKKRLINTRRSEEGKNRGK